MNLLFTVTLFPSKFQSNAMSTNTTISAVDLDQNVDDFNINRFDGEVIEVTTVCVNYEVDEMTMEIPPIPTDLDLPGNHDLTSTHDFNDQSDGMYGDNLNVNTFPDSQCVRRGIASMHRVCAHCVQSIE